MPKGLGCRRGFFYAWHAAAAAPTIHDCIVGRSLCETRKIVWWRDGNKVVAGNLLTTAIWYASNLKDVFCKVHDCWFDISYKYCCFILTNSIWPFCRRNKSARVVFGGFPVMHVMQCNNFYHYILPLHYLKRAFYASYWSIFHLLLCCCCCVFF